MDRAINIGLFFLALAMAALFFNVGFLMDPAVGAFDETFYSGKGLRIVFYSFMMASGISAFSACLALIGGIWISKAKIFSGISIVLLTIVSGVAWWSYSTFFYAVG